MTRLSVRDLAVARGGRRVAEGIGFDLDAGQALILRGPNGIGKTTLLRTVAGLQPPVQGAVTVDSDAIAYAGHADGLKSALTVAENLAFWSQVFGGPGPRAALVALDLGRLADRPAAMLSAVIFNALIIVALIPLSLRGVRYRPSGSTALLRRNLLVYGVGGLVAPFVGIKLIDLVVSQLPL